jgi:1-acyl-sn-glycerol-3-phosphate acyltransferase
MFAVIRALLITDPLIILATVVFGSFSLVVSFFDRDGRAQMRVARAWARALLWISGVQVRCQGLERVDPNASYVIASNHVSYMDTPAILANIPVQFRFMAKEGLFRIPLLGGHLKRAGHIAVPRDDPRAAIRALSEAARIIATRGISILVFPEGGRSVPGEGLQEFKEGGAYIAIKAGVPIVPVAIEGTGAVLKRGSATVRSGQVLLRIGAPIATGAMSLHDRGALNAEVRRRIAEQLGIQSQPEEARK